MSDKKTYLVNYYFGCGGSSSIEVTDPKLFDKNDPSYLGEDALREHLYNVMCEKDLITLIQNDEVCTDDSFQFDNYEEEED